MKYKNTQNLYLAPKIEAEKYEKIIHIYTMHGSFFIAIS